jgi:tetratricopeptide (TPR) repeat protein
MNLRTIAVCTLLLATSVFASAKQDPWVELRTPHFVVVSNAGEKQARHTALEFERTRAVFHKRFPLAHVDGASPILVLALRDEKDFRALVPTAYLGKGSLQLAGLFLRVPDQNCVMLRLDINGQHPYETIYHEYTHFVLSRDIEVIPLWLNEGLAEFFQTIEIADKEVRLGEPSVGNVHLLRQNRLLPLATLFAVDHNSPYYHEENKGSIFYAESWALTHYLEFKDRHEHTQRVAQYISLVSNKVDPVTAAVTAFGDLKVLEKNLNTYIAQPSFQYLTSPGATEVDESAFQLQPLTPAQADTFRAQFLAYNQRNSDASALLDRVLQQDPANASAYETQGYLALQSGDPAKAAACYERAVKLDSQNFFAHYRFASTTMQLGRLNDNAAQIESSLRTAIRLNPSFAPAYDQLAVFLAQRNSNSRDYGSEEALTLSTKAVQLEPFNFGFRLNAASVLLEMRRTKDAIAVLDAASKLTSDPAQLAMIAQQQQSIRSFEGAMAHQQERYQKAAERARAFDEAHSSPPPADPSPELSRRGPRKFATGTLTDVQCQEPAVMHVTLQGAKQPLPLLARNYYKIAYSSLGFTPTSDKLNPCTDLDNKKAKVEYYAPADDSSEGQIISIEIH